MASYLRQAEFPTELALHKKFAPSELVLDLVWTHSNAVLDITLDLYDSKRFDTSCITRGLAIKAALLFDIGVYCCSGFEFLPGQPPQATPYSQHTVIGAKILTEEGYAPEICRVAQVHTGVGLTAEDIASHMIDLPEGDYMPISDLEWLITYTSKFHSKAPKFKTVEEIETSLAKYGEVKLQTFQNLKNTFGVPHLAQIQEQYGEWERSFKYRISQLTTTSVQNSVISYPSVDLNSAGIAVPVATPTVTIETPPPGTTMTPPAPV